MYWILDVFQILFSSSAFVLLACNPNMPSNFRFVNSCQIFILCMHILYVMEIARENGQWATQTESVMTRIHVYIHMYMCIHAYAHPYMCMYACVCVRVSVYLYAYGVVRIHMWMWVQAKILMHAIINIWIWIHVPTPVCVCV